jgi:NADPH-dependent 2,4-dienoyl-CoA reductase/sulfur reductase-like enzyme
VLHTGQELAFDGLVIATGSQPRTFPGADGMDRVHVLRTLDQSVAIKDAFATARTVAVVGGGFIGSEVASTAKDLGLDVTVVEALPLPLVRVLGEEMGQVFADLHRRHGVELRLGVGVTAIDNGRILMADGTSVEADVVVVGIGVTPATEWLDGSGLTLDNGVVCDATCAAEGAEGVVAAGDVCRWFNPLFEQHMRVEHWTNAAEQAEAAAATLVRGPDRAEPFAPVPYFWSDQYDVKVQMVGIPGPEVHVVEGSADDGRFVAAYGREGRIVGALAFSQPRLLMKYRAQIADRGPFPPPTP